MTVLFYICLMVLIAVTYFIGFLVGEKRGIKKQYKNDLEEFEKYNEEIIQIIRNPFEE